MKVLIIDDVCFDKQHDTVARHEFEYLQRQGHTVYLYGWGDPQIILIITLSSVRNLLATFGGKLKNFGDRPD